MGVIVAGLLFGGINSLREGAFGAGDIKLSMISGFLLGWKRTLVALAVAVLLAGGGCIFLIGKGAEWKQRRIAFGPFLCAGIACSLIFGFKIIEWYTGGR